jgi:hypothetical protein
VAWEERWGERLREQADRVAARRLSFFDLEDCDLGQPIDWNRDHKSGKAAPKRFAAWIDYRDFKLTGDCKFVWEPNRHHQLVVLGRAYRATGEKKFAAAAVEQMDSWMEQCPYGIGMNWRSPLELGVRLINWAWTVELIGDSGLVAGAFRERLLNSVYRHIWEIDRKYSQGSSVNNHLVGEAAGVFVAAGFFRGFKDSARWRARSRAILEREILAQTWPDGGTREQAIGYQLFVLQFFLIAGLVARKTGQDFSSDYWTRLEKMLAFLGALGEGGENLPMFGDCDDGYVLDLGGERGDVRPWLAAGAILFNRPEFKAWSGEYSETAYWLLGPDSRRQWDAILPLPSESRLTSRAFPETGYYLLQWNAANEPQEAMSVVFDCAELGFGPLAAHGHADALSFTLRVGGRDILVDPGTYDYFTYPEWRKYFRSTQAHNTVVIDGQNQSEMLGPFLWGERATARCLAWQLSPTGGTVTGEHDGYGRLKDPVTHRRTLTLDGPTGTLTVRDDLAARGRHAVEVCFHLAENCQVQQVSPASLEITVGTSKVLLEFDPRLTVQVQRGSTEPLTGWVSRGYHRKAPAYTLVGRCQVEGSVSLVCRAQVRRAAPASELQKRESNIHVTR